MSKNIMQALKVEKRRYIDHYKIIYQEYLEAQNSKDYRTIETKLRFVDYKRGQVVEAGYVLKSLFNLTDNDLDEMEKKIERRYLKE